jgi:hypothetical protein
LYARFCRFSQRCRASIPRRDPTVASRDRLANNRTEDFVHDPACDVSHGREWHFQATEHFQRTAFRLILNRSRVAFKGLRDRSGIKCFNTSGLKIVLHNAIGRK